MMLLYSFGYRWPIFPLTYPGWDHPLGWVLPGLTLGLTGAAWYSRMLRSRMLDILGRNTKGGARQGPARAHRCVAPHHAQRLAAPSSRCSAWISAGSWAAC